MAVDIYLKLDGIKGESQDSKHKDEIDILSWSWGAMQSGTTHMGGGSGGGKSSFQDLSFTKYIDKSSPTLMQYLAKGKHIPKANLVVRKAGDNPLEYIKLDMEDVIVTSISTGGSGGEDRLTENVTLNFGSFKQVYTPQAESGGEKGKVEFAYDIAANEAK